jgi:hydroxyethylthiazole kinase-like uncharacterized protein yjeF
MNLRLITGVTDINGDVLHDWPLPMPPADGDKEERGRILVIGGSREMPGAIILAATAALRAGAGKLTIATGESVAHLVALAIPESRVIGLPETDAGGIAPSSARLFERFAGQLDAVLIGPGMQDEAATAEFVLALLPVMRAASVVLDAYAMSIVRHARMASSPHLLLTPHAGEMAHLSDIDKEAITADPVTAAYAAAQRWNAVIVLKGAATCIAAPDGRLWRHEGGNIGLAISGSGDTLAGIIAGLAARGASLEQAAAWGVALHARAGESLARKLGPLGYLATEIPAEIPALMHSMGTNK